MNTINRTGLELKNTYAATHKAAHTIFQNTGNIVDIWHNGTYLGSVWFGRLEHLSRPIKQWSGEMPTA